MLPIIGLGYQNRQTFRTTKHVHAPQKEISTKCIAPNLSVQPPGVFCRRLFPDSCDAFIPDLSDQVFTDQIGVVVPESLASIACFCTKMSTTVDSLAEV